MPDSSAASSFLSVDECRTATEILNKGAEILEARADEQEAGGDKHRAESTRGHADTIRRALRVLDGSKFMSNEFPTLEDGKAATAAQEAVL